MALQGNRDVITLPMTGGVAGTPPANTIAVADAANPGNGKASTAAALGFLGVTIEPADARGYSATRVAGIVQVRVGAAAVNAGDSIASDANGNAATIVPAAAAANVKMIIGVALNSAPAGALVDVLLQPKFTTG